MALTLGVALGLTGPAVQVEAATFRLLVGVIYDSVPYVRLPTGTAVVEKSGGATETATIKDGQVSFTIPDSGTSYVTFSGGGAPADFTTRRFELTFDATTGLLSVYDLDVTDTRHRQVGYGQGRDGSFHLDYLYAGIFIYEWADLNGPILGQTHELPLYADAFTIAPGIIEMGTRNDVEGFYLRRGWPYSDFQNQIPKLNLTWYHPDGSTTQHVFTIPGAGTMADGSDWYSFQTADGSVGVSGPIWALHLHYTPAFCQSLAIGTHWIVYQMVDADGSKSNTRVEQVKVQR